MWFHAKCERLGNNGIQSWSDVDGEYICQSCRIVDGTAFDYLAGMHRLEKVSMFTAHSTFALIFPKAFCYHLRVNIHHFQNKF